MSKRKFRDGQYVVINVCKSSENNGSLTSTYDSKAKLWMNGSIAKVLGMERGQYVVAITKGQREDEYRILETELKKVSKLDVLLHLYDLRTVNDADGERALYHMLCRYKDKLPKLDGYFHKAFRQCDVVCEEDGGHMDMAFWCLLYDAKKFWVLFEEVQKKGTTQWA